MNIEEKINYVESLVELTLSRVSDVIRKRKNKTSINDSVEGDNGYLYDLHQNLTDFKLELTNFKLAFCQKLTDQVIPNEMSLLLIMYLQLLESLLHTILVREGGISKKFIVSAFSIFDKIINSVATLIEKNFLSAEVTERLIPAVIDLKGLLENEQQILLAKDIRAESNNRINSEIDKAKASLKNELNEISNQYSEGRTILMESVDEYKRAINSLMEDTVSKLDEYRGDIERINSESNYESEKVKGLLVSVESCLAMANSALEKSNQVGMAAAFQKRYKSLVSAMIIWFITFIVSLGGLLFVGFIFIDSAFSSEIKTIAELISKAAISFPLIWGAWFSAKQYSHVSQLREDYAYKVAVAMTYHGYKNEAAEINDEMSGKLLANIITHFSENPVRLYQNNNSASVIEAMLKNDKLSDIINSAKSGISGSAKS
ncbi:hypothetical protein [Aeromonas enteropelogenes]|uniref:hypothetical protein n=1 Tax=Aeromonas enteropelogenes TaxID=29489 RepID=UPI003BA08DD8